MGFVGYQVQPCKTDRTEGGKEFVAPAEPEDAEYWGVYGIDRAGLKHWLKDCRSVGAAYAFLLEREMFKDKGA